MMNTVDPTCCFICFKQARFSSLSQRDITDFRTATIVFENSEFKIQDFLSLCPLCWHGVKVTTSFIASVRNCLRIWDEVTQQKVKLNEIITNSYKNLVKTEASILSIVPEQCKEVASVKSEAEIKNEKMKLDERNEKVDVCAEDVTPNLGEPRHNPTNCNLSNVQTEDSWAQKHDNVSSDCAEEVFNTEDTFEEEKLRYMKYNFAAIKLTELEQKLQLDQKKLSKTYLNACFKCHLCGWHGSDYLAYDIHMEKHAEVSGSLECDLCKLRFKSVYCLSAHKRNMHLFKWKCKKCHHVLFNENSCRRHFFLCSGDGQPVECTLCNRYLKNRVGLELHMKKHSLPDKFVCDCCGRSFKTKNDVRCHIISHHMKPFKCGQCGKKLSSSIAFKRHVKAHEEVPLDESNYCVECNRYFKHLARHYQYSPKHVDKEKKFSCEYCPQSFAEKYTLEVHRNTIHLNIRKYSCRLCPKKYASSGNLSTHVRMKHSAAQLPKAHVCSVCGKAFVKRNLLQDHSNMHTNERPHKCDQCPATFNFRAALWTHNKLKHKKKPVRYSLLGPRSDHPA